MMIRKKHIAFIVSLFLVSYLYAQQQDLVQYVNTLQGSHNTPEFSHGRCSPLVGYPHGMNLWSPRGGFGYGGSRGANGAFGGGGLLFLPAIGSLEAGTTNAKQTEEVGKPHHHKTAYDNGVVTEMTSTERCGHFRVTFPRKQKAYLIINGNVSAVNVDPAKRTLTSSSGQNHYILQFNQPFVSNGKMEGTGGRQGGIYIEFKPGTKVEFKMVTSNISLEQAQTTFDREIAQHNFDQVKDAAYKVWNDLLNTIVVEGGTLEQRKTFYSCFYRASLRPSKISEIDKDGKSHFAHNGKVYEGYYHANPILWDAYRSLFPLRNIINTAGQKEYVLSLLKTKQLNGWWEWRPNGPIMLGNHAISVFADAWAKGVRTFNPDTVLANYYHEVTNQVPHTNPYNIEHRRGYGRMEYGDYFALGYNVYPKDSKKVMESVARTLEYTYDDFCAYQLAKMSGNKFYEDVFKKHMYNYKNVFDPKDHFMKGRDADGSWQNNFNPYEWGGPYCEGNAWPWKWFVPHDAEGLSELIGSKEQMAKELDELFAAPADSALNGGYNERIHEINESVAADNGQYGGINEPGFHIIYLYNHVNQPWKAQKLLRESMVKLFNSGPKGFMGDEDGGAVSSWYMMSALGFFPVTAGVDQYSIGSPLFNKATINLENGKKFIISANNNSADNVYINSATLNGKAYTKNFLNHADIMNGGELNYTMSAQPNTQRGTGEGDKPYSVSASQDAQDQKRVSQSTHK